MGVYSKQRAEVVEKVSGVFRHWMELELEQRRIDAEFDKLLTPDDRNYLWAMRIEV